MRVKSGTDSKSRVEYRGGGGDTGRHSSSSSVSSVRPSFDFALEEVEIYDLLDRLDVIAEKLSVFPAARLIAEYRSVMAEIIKSVLNGFNLKRDLRWRKTSRTTFVTIERAEAALDELEEAIMQEGDRSRAISLMEEIKGCLISLLF